MANTPKSGNQRNGDDLSVLIEVGGRRAPAEPTAYLDIRKLKAEARKAETLEKKARSRSNGRPYRLAAILLVVAAGGAAYAFKDSVMSLPLPVQGAAAPADFPQPKSVAQDVAAKEEGQRAVAVSEYGALRAVSERIDAMLALLKQADTSLQALPQDKDREAAWKAFQVKWAADGADIRQKLQAQQGSDYSKVREGLQSFWSAVDFTVRTAPSAQKVALPSPDPFSGLKEQLDEIAKAQSLPGVSP